MLLPPCPWGCSSAPLRSPHEPGVLRVALDSRSSHPWLAEAAPGCLAPALVMGGPQCPSESAPPPPRSLCRYFRRTDPRSLHHTFGPGPSRGRVPPGQDSSWGHPLIWNEAWAWTGASNVPATKKLFGKTLVFGNNFFRDFFFFNVNHFQSLH